MKEYGKERGRQPWRKNKESEDASGKDMIILRKPSGSTTRKALYGAPPGSMKERNMEIMRGERQRKNWTVMVRDGNDVQVQKEKETAFSVAFTPDRGEGQRG